MNTLAAIGVKHIKDMIINNRIESMCMESHEEIISRLKFLGHIQKDEKIDVRHVNRQQNNFVTKITRSIIYPDNRANSLKFIKDIVTRSFEIIDYYNNQNNSIVSKAIVSDLVKARQGILNLKYTYNDDTKFCCDMDVLIQTIGTHITKLQEKNPELFEEQQLEKK